MFASNLAPEIILFTKKPSYEERWSDANKNGKDFIN